MRPKIARQVCVCLFTASQQRLLRGTDVKDDLRHCVYLVDGWSKCTKWRQ
jgi:hypothetical protein